LTKIIPWLAHLSTMRKVGGIANALPHPYSRGKAGNLQVRDNGWLVAFFRFY